MKTSKVPLADLLTVVSKRCADEMERYPRGSKEYVYFVAFLEDIGDMISSLKRLEESQKLRRL
jgi:hypothetical protein